MTAPVVGILEDSAERVERFAEALAATGVAATIIDHDNAPDFIQWLADEPHAVALLSLDYDLIESGRVGDHGTGMDVVRTLCGRPAGFPVILHSSAPERRRQMSAALLAGGWLAQSVELSAPGGHAAWAGLAQRLLKL